MKQNFNFHRFLTVLKWDIITNRTRLIQTTLGLAFGLAFTAIIQNYCMRDITNDFTSNISSSMVPLIYVILGCFYFIMGTQIFSNIRTKTQREQFFMLPATNLEKYTSRLTITIVGTLIIELVALVMADVIQFIAGFLIVKGHHFSIFYSAIVFGYKTIIEVFDDRLFKDFYEIWPFLLLTFAMRIHAFAFCIFGGSLFRKHSTLMTIATGMTITMGFGFVLGPIVEYVDFSFNGSDAITIAKISSCIMLLLSAIYYYCSYKVFTRMQVISNKWLNY